ncbi:TRMT1-like protein [Frankliniella fusca]|uniref:TRMT1-like protein n=1 Tax=Frankliniella fusca TaxID=407009 RepID=A0AAE1H1W1_9NEOP|nr:TRMT1-like protein [Frankliniella fusca]
MAYKRFGRHRMAFKISQAIRTRMRMELPPAPAPDPAPAPAPLTSASASTLPVSSWYISPLVSFESFLVDV